MDVRNLWPLLILRIAGRFNLGMEWSFFKSVSILRTAEVLDDLWKKCIAGCLPFGVIWPMEFNEIILPSLKYV